MIYLCNRHNDVNLRLEKPLFPCYKVIDAWGKSGCGCSPSDLANITQN